MSLVHSNSHLFPVIDKEKKVCFECIFDKKSTFSLEKKLERECVIGAKLLLIYVVNFFQT